MTRRALLLMVCLSTLACRPGPNRPAAPETVWNITVRDLHYAYSVNDPRWDGQRVRIYIPIGHYEVGPDFVRWNQHRPTDGPDVMFECERPPVDNLRNIFVTGLVLGRVADQERRRSGNLWHVRVVGCVVTAQ